MNVENKLKEMICEKAFDDIYPNDICFGKNLIDDLGFDSIALILLVIEIEEEFGISLDNDEINQNELADYRFLYTTVNSLIQSKEIGEKDVYQVCYA